MNAAQALAARQALSSIAEDVRAAIDGSLDPEAALLSAHRLAVKALEELPEMFGGPHA